MKALLLFFLLFELNCFGQTFEVSKDEYPYNEILEWKGHGALLMSKDPTEKSRKINLTLVGKELKGAKSQSFTPKGKKYYYLAGENSDYVYFLDNLELDEGKYFFSQLGSNGILKTSSSVLTHLLTMVFKNIGDLNINDLKLVDIIVTEKALVHIFRYHNLKENKYTEIAIFMAHTNMISSACILGEIKEEAFNDEYINHWKFIGSSGDKMYFAVRGYNKQLKKGWLVSGFNTKAEMIYSSFIPNSTVNFEPVEDKGFGTTGKHYLNEKGEVEPNLLFNFNDNFYLTGIALVNGSRELKTYKLKEQNKELIWEQIYSYTLKPSTKSKVSSTLGVYPLNEGIGAKLEQSNFLTVVFMPFDKTVGTSVTLYSDKILFNPSRMFIKEKKQDFSAMLTDRKLFFSYTQLNNTGSVMFECVIKPK